MTARIHDDGEDPGAVNGVGMAEQRLWSESEIDTKKEKVLAFCAESREGWWEMEGRYRGELGEYESIWDRPDLWAFAGGAVLDLVRIQDRCRVSHYNGTHEKSNLRSFAC